MESAKCAAELGKIIKYGKNLGKMKKILQFLLLFKWLLLEPKMFTVQWAAREVADDVGRSKISQGLLSAQ